MRKLLRPRIIILLVAILVIGGAVWWFLLRDSKEEILTQTDFPKVFNEFSVSEQDRITNLIAKTTSVEELVKLSSKDQADVGIAVIQKKITEKDNAGANLFIAELMKRDDATGLGAARLCYTIAPDDAAKNVCRTRANEIAREQKIIGPTETLPDSYFNLNQSEEQG